jgi:hypothetical protein
MPHAVLSLEVCDYMLCHLLILGCHWSACPPVRTGCGSTNPNFQVDVRVP